MFAWPLIFMSLSKRREKYYRVLVSFSMLSAYFFTTFFPFPETCTLLHFSPYSIGEGNDSAFVAENCIAFFCIIIIEWLISQGIPNKIDSKAQLG